MKPFPSNLDRARVATPCTVSWEEMSGDNRVRFCDQCQLNVYNFSELSRLEAETLLATTEGRLCGRLYRRADGTIITKDCPVGLRALRKRVSKRIAAIFATVAAISSAALGQEVSTKGDNSCGRETTIKIKRSSWDQTGARVSGKITDPCGAVITNAEIRIDLNGAEKKKFVTGDDGAFRLDTLPEGDYTIHVSAQFFGPYVAHLRLERNRIVNLEIVLQPGSLMGDVVIVDPKVRFETKPGTTIMSGEQNKKLPLQK
ncbi:MAG TPA: carboxypeptidase-like regulatory domain-containing protein [Pyrinomonadaceae bacterium]|nr:carboxypeptidase-like regulatory domain-containing protein [Pyrinomonadaceae bacterium]